MSIFTGKGEIVCRRRRQKCAGVHVCKNVDPLLLEDRRELNPKSLEDVIKAQVESRVNETDSTAKRTIMYLFPVMQPEWSSAIFCSITNMQLDSFQSSTRSLAVGRNQMAQNAMDIQL